MEKVHLSVTFSRRVARLVGNSALGKTSPEECEGEVKRVVLVILAINDLHDLLNSSKSFALSELAFVLVLS